MKCEEKFVDTVIGFAKENNLDPFDMLGLLSSSMLECSFMTGTDEITINYDDTEYFIHLSPLL